MSVGHFLGHFKSSSGCVVSKLTLRHLLHTGVAAWLKSFPRSTLHPCCDLRFVGGDGTMIGIPLKNIPSSVKSVWEPTVLQTTIAKHNRTSREPLGDLFGQLCSDQAVALRNELKHALKDEMTELERHKISTDIPRQWPVLKKCVPEFLVEFCRWSALPSTSNQFKPLREFLRSTISAHSVTGCFPFHLAKALMNQQVALKQGLLTTEQITNLRLSYAFHGFGLGMEVLDIFEAQLSDQGSVVASTVELTLFLGMGTASTFGKHRSIQTDITHLILVANRSLQIIEHYHQQTEASEDEQEERPNPAVTGIRYMATVHGRSLRRKWPLPKTGVSRMKQSEMSNDGCEKRRSVMIGNKERTALWFTFCMVHEKVIGYHLILHSEGHRDSLFPIYRFFEKPPDVVWNDFGCGCEESGLNWLPTYFCKTQHFHDMFHGFSHVCPPRFFSRRLPAYSAFNTSVMEQVLNHTQRFLVSNFLIGY
jgi:hypothetical protein